MNIGPLGEPISRDDELVTAGGKLDAAVGLFARHLIGDPDAQLDGDMGWTFLGLLERILQHLVDAGVRLPR